ncbi:MAG: alpha/beta hydrolase [Pseudomonadota bacterium]
MRVLTRKLFRLTASLALAIPTVGCTPARLLNAVISESGYRIERDIVYGESDRHRLDIYVPDELEPDAAVAVFFYGGRWQYGSKADYLFVGQAMASLGMITVIADYRLHPDVDFPDFVKDGAESVGWVRRHIGSYGGDPNRIFLVGHSAGAYNALMLALNPEFLAAHDVRAESLGGVIGLAGPYDFLPIKEPDIKAIFAVDDLATTQPITYANAKAPSTLLLAGGDDDTVSPGNSIRLQKAITERGGDANIKVYEGVSHVGIILATASPFRWWAPVLEDIEAFVDKARRRTGQPNSTL